jgi:hypothetical protein
VIDTGHVRDHGSSYRREHPNRDLLTRIDHAKWVRTRFEWPLTQVERHAASKDWQDNGLVFPSRVGTPSVLALRHA